MISLVDHYIERTEFVLDCSGQELVVGDLWISFEEDNFFYPYHSWELVDIQPEYVSYKNTAYHDIFTVNRNYYDTVMRFTIVKYDIPR